MGDDSFSDFRDWPISRGRRVYEQTLENPDSLAEVPDARRGAITAELMHGVMYDAYEQAHKRELPWVGPGEPVKPSGTYWTTPAELQRMLPELFRKSGWPSPDPAGD